MSGHLTREDRVSLVAGFWGQRITTNADQLADVIAPAVESIVARHLAACLSTAAEQLEDERAARQVAGESADRFRDVLSECLGHDEENPGDDALLAEVRAHFGKTGPEPMRWRNFLAGALAQVDQIRAARAASLDADPDLGGVS